MILQEAFANSRVRDEYSESCVNHGRIEKRTCRIITDISWVCNAREWRGLKALVMIDTQRTEKNTGQTEQQTRYYIISLASDAKKINAVVRGHWGIENKLHWILDIVFAEDKSRKRAGNDAENFSTITKIVLNILKKKKDYKGAKKISTKTKRFRCNISLEYLTNVL